MSPSEYQELARRTSPTSYPQFNKLAKSNYINGLIHAQFGISSEAGELADAVKKYMVYGKDLDFDNILEECGDLLWYISLALTCCGFSLEEAMQTNIDKLRIRYPEKFTEKDALERKDKI